MLCRHCWRNIPMSTFGEPAEVISIGCRRAIHKILFVGTLYKCCVAGSSLHNTHTASTAPGSSTLTWPCLLTRPKQSADNGLSRPSRLAHSLSRLSSASHACTLESSKCATSRQSVLPSATSAMVRVLCPRDRERSRRCSFGDSCNTLSACSLAR